MIARAPGKIVLSGAYSVLAGAPAIVAAVDRYVTADASRDASIVTPEVAAAIATGYIDRAPWFDASPLRAATASGTRKLGLGSSAAILVASLAASLDRREDIADVIFEKARAAHAKAQGGGSGIDVAASTFGGVLRCERTSSELSVTQHPLPVGFVVTIFASSTSISTAAFVARVNAFADRDPILHARLIADAADGARAAVEAADVPELVRAIDRQTDALAQLGAAARVPIVPSEIAALRPAAAAERAAFSPSGAGGGDVAIFAGRATPSSMFVAKAARAGLERLSIAIGSLGVHGF